MRLCFYNPHAITNSVGETLLSGLARVFGVDKSNLRKHNLKYGFFLDLLRDDKYNTAIVVDGSATSFNTILNRIPILKNSYLTRRIITLIEIRIWCKLNKISAKKQKVIFNKKKLDKNSDILFNFAFCSDNFFNEKLIQKSIIRSFNGKKILHASHFYKSTGKVSSNIEKTGTKYMIAEADLKKSAYFNKFFHFIDQVYILSHVLRPRYIKTKEFNERKNMCLALGTLVLEDDSDESNKDHYNFFKVNTLHPMRKTLFENKKEMEDMVECLINFHNKDRLEIAEKSSLYRKFNIFRTIYNIFFLSEGKAYHSMNIVDKYNEYKMFISPEENIGLSSVNFVEGMACGCAYIGLNHPMYTDLGMVDGVNFIAYDGTLSDLKDKITYYQNHHEKLEKIANNGYEFSKKNFTESKILEDFWKYLEELSSK